MSDEELKKMVQHLAQIHGVTPEHLVDEVISGEDHEEAILDSDSEDQSAVADPDIQEEIDEEQPKLKRRGKSHWAAWATSLAVVGVGVGVVIIVFMKFLNGPASAQANPITLAQAEASPSASPAANQLVGLYIELQYPGIFDQVAQVKNGTALEQYNINSKADYKRQISIDVSNLPSGNLNDDSSYRYREINPALYKETSATIRGEAVALMTKLDGSEQTLFWAHGGHELIVAVTSSDATDSVKSYMAFIMPTIQWRQ